MGSTLRAESLSFFFKKTQPPVITRIHHLPCLSLSVDMAVPPPEDASPGRQPGEEPWHQHRQDRVKAARPSRQPGVCPEAKACEEKGCRDRRATEASPHQNQAQKSANLEEALKHALAPAKLLAKARQLTI